MTVEQWLEGHARQGRARGFLSQTEFFCLCYGLGRLYCLEAFVLLHFVLRRSLCTAVSHLGPHRPGWAWWGLAFRWVLTFLLYFLPAPLPVSAFFTLCALSAALPKPAATIERRPRRAETTRGERAKTSVLSDGARKPAASVAPSTTASTGREQGAMKSEGERTDASSHRHPSRRNAAGEDRGRKDAFTLLAEVANDQTRLFATKGKGPVC